jgi:hypothetical protein
MKQLNHEEQILRQEILACGMATEEQIDGGLSVPFMQNCHSRVNHYLSLVRPDDVENAYNKPARIEAGRQELERAKAKKFWQNPTASEHQAEYAQAGDDFADTHPAFISTNRSNLQEMGIELAKQNLNPTLDNLNKVYRDLVLAGRLIIAVENIPGAPAAAPSECTGIVLQRWVKQFPHILEPVVRKTDRQLDEEYVKNLSSEDYRRERMLPDDTLPPMIEKQIAQSVATFVNHHPEIDFSEGVVREILLGYLTENKIAINYNSLELAYETCHQKIADAGMMWSEYPGHIASHGSSSLRDHRKPYIPPIERPITLDPPDTPKRIDMDNLLALPSDEFQRVVNGTPGLRELLDGERS